MSKNQCLGQIKTTQNYLGRKRCSRKVEGLFCSTHQPSISDQNVLWVIKEIKRIAKDHKHNHGVQYLDTQVYLTGDQIMIWSILEEADPDQSFLTIGQLGKSLKVYNFETLKESSKYRQKMIQDQYYRDSKLDYLVDDASLDFI